VFLVGSLSKIKLIECEQVDSFLRRIFERDENSDHPRTTSVPARELDVDILRNFCTLELKTSLVTVNSLCDHFERIDYPPLIVTVDEEMIVVFKRKNDMPFVVVNFEDVYSRIFVGIDFRETVLD
jgi:hypothetical protein